MPIDALQTRWNALIRACGADAGKASPFFDALVGAYGEPHRVYHTLGHLAHMFAALDAVPLWDPAVEWATWYHDVCYQPGDQANEQRSAQMAQHALANLGVDSALGRRVTQLIEATRAHEANSGDAVQQLFLDADLSILGAPTEDYGAYARAIREEHRHIPDVLYRRGRKAFLQQMLSRDSIFLSEHFRCRYEIQAQGNLARELAGFFR